MKTALIYSFNTHNTKEVAKQILKALDKFEVDEVNAEEVDGIKFSLYDNIIIGAPTWFSGELPNYWDEFIPELKDLDLRGKKIAIFGNGDQEKYPYYFVDAIGIMADLFEKAGATIVGNVALDGYTFFQSKAVKNNLFQGLPIDFENQSNLTAERISKWTGQLMKQFHLMPK